MRSVMVAAGVDAEHAHVVAGCLGPERIGEPDQRRIAGGPQM